MKNESIATSYCINVPEDATNGDVIKAMFPDAEWHNAMGQTTIFIPKTAIYNIEVLRVSTDWWNAKYKEEK